MKEIAIVEDIISYDSSIKLGSEYGKFNKGEIVHFHILNLPLTGFAGYAIKKAYCTESLEYSSTFNFIDIK